MKKKKIHQLGKPGIVDTATKFTGELSSYHVYGSGAAFYFFQPNAIDPETKTPIKGFFITENRIDSPYEKFKPALFPDEAIGSIVEDINSKFSGMAIEMTIHKNGCVHFDVQSSERTKNGGKVAMQNFDIRSLKGEMLPVFTEAEKKVEDTDRPSPRSLPSHSTSL